MELSLDQIGLRYAYDYGKGKNYTGGDKTSLGQNFTPQYDRLLNHLRDKEITFLELGIYHGKSLAMWSDYFPRGHIYGIDLDLKLFTDHERDLRKHGAFRNTNIHVFEQDVTSDQFKDFIKTIPMMDVIIDDALHKPETQANNFIALFDKLKPGGYYIIEDIIDPVKFMLFFKDILTIVSNADIPGLKRHEHYRVANKIESVEICKNMVILKRYKNY